jgi:archaellum biogenesis protein FlaJ (TadC family)
MGKPSTENRGIDPGSLAAILNPAIFIILLGGLLLGFDTTTLIIVGVVGYALWGVLNVISKRMNQREELAKQSKKKGKSNKQQSSGFDLSAASSLLNLAILIVLFVGVVQGWDLGVLITIGVIGYGFWFFITAKSRQKVGKAKKRRN